MSSSNFYKKSILGYNVKQVEQDIDEYEEIIDTLEENLNKIKQEYEELNSKNNVLNKEIQILKRDIYVKDKAMREMSKIAISEANHLVNSASKNADIIVTEALNTAKSILLELTYTSKLNNDLKSNLKSQIDDIITKINKFEAVELPDLRWLANYDKKQ